ncbi:hypothetical protein VNO78_21666 [Psophocarpus tetragonolobus]|uniref:Legume lectin domain-containing protein n=1 Tax=Psophocarpus tetragonolobus TaxID=3891 RepID=A0AAN9SDM4_PSOTE
MGGYNLKSHGHSLCIPLSISLILFLLLNKVNSTQPQSFNFVDFEPGDEDLIFQNDAYVTPSGVLHLTKVDQNGTPIKNSIGRALFADPIQIWDSTTNKVASFQTRFTFSINQTHRFGADGLAFFMAPTNTKPAQGGGFLGLFNTSEDDKSSQILAIEFDTFQNSFDSGHVPHIGIDVNSIRSIKSHYFYLDNEEVANVSITYDASSKILHAAIVYPSVGIVYQVAEIVDLKEVLSERVLIGFSASTGQGSQTHHVHSWSFSASFPGINNGIATLDHNTLQS